MYRIRKTLHKHVIFNREHIHNFQLKSYTKNQILFKTKINSIQSKTIIMIMILFPKPKVIDKMYVKEFLGKKNTHKNYEKIKTIKNV